MKNKMDDHSKEENTICIGRWIKDDYYIYKVAQIQNVERTIEEYGIPRPWSLAQQVLCYPREEVFGDMSLAETKAILLLDKFPKVRVIEKVFYDTPFPEDISMQDATGYLLGYEKDFDRSVFDVE